MSTIKIRMLKTAAGPDGPFQEGREYNVLPQMASAYVNAGAAKFVGGEVFPVTEKAVQPTGEARSEEEAPAEEWPLKTPPEEYIARNADSDSEAVQERVALARRILEG